MTEEQFEKNAVYLFENVSAEELAKAPGIGIKNAREFLMNLKGLSQQDPSLDDY